MNSTNQGLPSIHPLERVLCLSAAVACDAITILLWQRVSLFQPIWPLPAMYFIELVLLTAAAATWFLSGRLGGVIVLWVVTGVLAGFCILGSFSVGFIYWPITLLFLAAAAISEWRSQTPFGPHLAICLFAATAQAAVMLGIIRLMYP